MNWEDEDWIKVYKRDEADWLVLSFAARGLFLQILRKLNRHTGTLKLGRLGKPTLAVLVHGSESEVTPLLDELLRDGCVTLSATNVLFVPNFVDAQNARTNARVRKARSRAARGEDSLILDDDGFEDPYVDDFDLGSQADQAEGTAQADQAEEHLDRFADEYAGDPQADQAEEGWFDRFVEQGRTHSVSQADQAEGTAQADQAEEQLTGRSVTMRDQTSREVTNRIEEKRVEYRSDPPAAVSVSRDLGASHAGANVVPPQTAAAGVPRSTAASAERILGVLRSHPSLAPIATPKNALRFAGIQGDRYSDEIVDQVIQTVAIQAAAAIDQDNDIHPVTLAGRIQQYIPTEKLKIRKPASDRASGRRAPSAARQEHPEGAPWLARIPK